MQIIIVGAGAAGLIAAIAAAREGASVTILEGNDRPGRKLLCTGNGRCNITNSDIYDDSYESFAGDEGSFVRTVLERFGVQDTIRFFSELGIYTKNRKGWLYPQSDQAASVLSVLEMEAHYRKVKLKSCAKVREINRKGDQFIVHADQWSYPCDRIILACGSKASGVEGAGEEGYRLAEGLGHTVTPLLPALVPLQVHKDDLGRWAGVRMECAVSLLVDQACISASYGEVQFTDYGVSGIPVFQLSARAAKALAGGADVSLSMDFMPAFSRDALTGLLRMRRDNCPYKSMRELLIGLFPDKLIPVLLPDKQGLGAESEEVLDEISRRCKALTVRISRPLSFTHAQVCCGGIPLEEIDPQTMASRLVPGLYFAGEVVDVNGQCGGYNLQWAWSSGVLAGRASAALSETPQARNI